MVCCHGKSASNRSTASRPASTQRRPPASQQSEDAIADLETQVNTSMQGVLTRSSKIRISTPIASVQKLCGSFYHIITWGKPQLSSAIPGGGRHPPPHPQKWPFLSKWPAIDLLKIMKKKKKKFSLFHLKSMQLYFTHLLVPKHDEPRPWGGP